MMKISVSVALVSWKVLLFPHEAPLILLFYYNSSVDFPGLMLVFGVRCPDDLNYGFFSKYVDD